MLRRVSGKSAAPLATDQTLIPSPGQRRVAKLGKRLYQFLRSIDLSKGPPNKKTNKQGVPRTGPAHSFLGKSLEAENRLPQKGTRHLRCSSWVSWEMPVYCLSFLLLPSSLPPPSFLPSFFLLFFLFLFSFFLSFRPFSPSHLFLLSSFLPPCLPASLPLCF